MSKYKLTRLLAAVTVVAALVGCAYGGVAMDGKRAVVAKNNGFLFGVLNKVYVCDVTDAGLKNCSTADNP